MLKPLHHWKRMRHMAPPEWELAWQLRRSPSFCWRSGMGMLYPDGSYATYQGFILPHGDPLPYLLSDRTAGCLMGLLSETGPGWQTTLREHLEGGGDWRIAVACGLLERWGEPLEEQRTA
ncbi:MAG: hypothetical protein H6739_33845 [Alphaproteobacteria bacterium]|nr:hypothetical protein [Alphaproteobacteria bacterium]